MKFTGTIYTYETESSFDMNGIFQAVRIELRSATLEECEVFYQQLLNDVAVESLVPGTVWSTDFYIGDKVGTERLDDGANWVLMDLHIGN